MPRKNVYMCTDTIGRICVQRMPLCSNRLESQFQRERLPLSCATKIEISLTLASEMPKPFRFERKNELSNAFSRNRDIFLTHLSFIAAHVAKFPTDINKRTL